MRKHGVIAAVALGAAACTPESATAPSNERAQQHAAVARALAESRAYEFAEPYGEFLGRRVRAQARLDACEYAADERGEDAQAPCVNERVELDVANISVQLFENAHRDEVAILKQKCHELQRESEGGGVDFELVCPPAARRSAI